MSRITSKIVTMTVTITDTMVMMMSAMAVIIAMMAPPIAETIQPIVWDVLVSKVRWGIRCG